MTLERGLAVLVLVMAWWVIRHMRRERKARYVMTRQLRELTSEDVIQAVENARKRTMIDRIASDGPCGCGALFPCPVHNREFSATDEEWRAIEGR